MDGVVLIIVVVCGTDNTTYILARGFIYILLLKHKLKIKVKIRSKNQVIGNN
jgi:hypothetical protein